MSVKVIKDLKEFEKLDKELEYMTKNAIYIGFLSEKIVDGVNVQTYAAWNEFGTVYIPARPFFRTATDTKKARRIIEDKIQQQIELVIEGKKTGKAAMEAIGLFVQGQIQLSIKKGKWQDNKESTINKKGKNNPLIDTGTMISSVSFEIRKR